jgi:hypothetical protein
VRSSAPALDRTAPTTHPSRKRRRSRIIAAQCIAFIGPGDDALPRDIALAERIAEAVVSTFGAHIVTGGLGGVMAAAARGATRAGGVAIGVIPGDEAGAAHPPHSYTVATGMGEARNAIVVNSADVVIAIGLGWGTVSEIALARRAGKEVLQIDGFQRAEAGLTTWDSAGETVDAVVGAVIACLESVVNQPV